ncbi:heme ABC transporter ATP-binding protein [Galbitalea sp. SE-J8]|uniref:heme ABC transporter ATP-binding protein n=1 Tax=Galbitalea sp. SE-J8 TaxID=3054952 RepID=UPI00259D1D05|nr:heme ABC transporter ATP-binding protein [Galbitalea sp. SE-J8]MDM4763939.1 heme ABC transporter ATP-binding protein [Galbitalea sp. SE-J8]
MTGAPSAPARTGAPSAPARARRPSAPARAGGPSAPARTGTTIAVTDAAVLRDGRTILDGVTLELGPGLTAIVGPNGAGKSTLLGVLSGDLAPASGAALIDGEPLHRLSHGELARRRSVLTQDNGVAFPFTVREIVEMGRSPWSRTASRGDDESAIAAALAETDIGHLVDRRFTSLSGGERARVSLARVLAQGTEVVLLDEPTAALDLGHQEEVMRTAAALAAAGRTVVVVVHDLSLAAAYADRVVVVAGGRLDAVGVPAEVLTVERIERVYGLEVELVERNGRFVVIPVRGGAS